MWRLRLLTFCLGWVAMTATAWAQRSYYRIGRTQVDRVVILDEGGYRRHYRIAVQHADSVQYLSPQRVDEYRNFEETIFRAYDLPDGERVFLEVVEEGTLTLLYLQDRNRIKRYFLELAPGALLELSEVPSNELYYKEVLRAAWRECLSLRDLVDDAAFEKADLRYVVQAHNRCEYIPRPQSRWMISAEVLYQRLDVAENSQASSLMPLAAYRSIDYDWVIGGGLSLLRELPLSSTYWYGVLGLRLQYLQAQENVLYSLRVGGDRAFNFEVNVLDIQVPLGLRYVAPRPKLRPAVFFGVIPSYWLGRVDGRQILYDLSQNVTNTPFIESLSPWGLSLQLRPGLDYQLNSTRVIRIEAGLQQRYGLQADRLFNLTSLLLGLGVSW